MNQQLKSIAQKIDNIQIGLLRFRDNKKRVTLQVRVKVFYNSLKCFIIENVNADKLLNKRVTLIQRSENDYLYLSGVVEKAEKEKSTVSIRILKACWFVRQNGGGISWLQEKFIFTISQHDKDIEPVS